MKKIKNGPALSLMKNMSHFLVDLHNRQPHWFEETVGFDVKISSVASHQNR